MREFEVQAEIAAPREAVWDVFTDHAGWTRWAGAREVVLRQQGDPPPNGLGAIRVIRAAGLAIEEEVTAFDPPERFVYQLVAGLPIRRHCGDVRFEATDGGTHATWRVRFAPLVPGTGALIAAILKGQLGRLLQRLATDVAGGR